MTGTAAPADDAVATDTGAGRFQVSVEVVGTKLVVDEPIAAGGLGSGPNPYQLLASALAACTTMTIRLYAEQKNWPVHSIRTIVGHERQAASTPADLFTRGIAIEGDLDGVQRARLMEIADRCPVHRTLTAGARVETLASESLPPPEQATAHAADMAAIVADTNP